MATIEEILQQEEQLANAKRTLDLDAIDRIYADDLLLTGVLGEPTCSKSAVLDEMRQGIAQRDAAHSGGAGFETRTENEDTKIVPLGDAAVANYRLVVRSRDRTWTSAASTGRRTCGRSVTAAGRSWPHTWASCSIRSRRRCWPGNISRGLVLGG